MKILNAMQIKELDAFTIEKEPIKSLDLMERAANACVSRLVRHLFASEEIVVLCGKGNNGGDGLAIARLLNERGFKARAAVINYTDKFSDDAKQNYDRFKQKYPEQLFEINTLEELKEKTEGKIRVAVDALLGTGINKKPEGLLGEVILFANKNFKSIISIDVPSGLYIDQTSKENTTVIHSTLTLSLQLPKLAFLLPENKQYVPRFEIVDIGLHEKGLETQSTSFRYLTLNEVYSLLEPRTKFSHKGTFGHGLLLAGSKGKSGAAIISAKACMRSGAGLLTLHSNKDTLNSLLIHLPEAMTSEDNHSDFISEVDKPERFDAIAFGPGVGTDNDTQQVLKKLLHYYNGKLVIDADGLNILSENKTWLSFLPPDTILTPHPKEFERLTEKHENDFDRLKALKEFSIKYNCIVILKGAHTAIAMPDGNTFFNSTGNAGLSKGGSGDALTGIILGLLTRGYNAPKAALIGTFIHGFAADLCLKKKSMESILISDVIDQLPKAFKKLEYSGE
jgi:hydroxyethylthiazole kinase-like uncharacterized protein yjeF